MWQPSWRQSGQEPDYRFSLANERTFLAWVRSALSLLAGGVLLAQFATRLSPAWLAVSIGLALAGFAGVLSVVAYRQWRANELAMRHARPLPGNPAVPMLSLFVFLVAVATVAALWHP
jgi:putative membrane protein